jgi:hypothetical protein
MLVVRLTLELSGERSTHEHEDADHAAHAPATQP